MSTAIWRSWFRPGGAHRDLVLVEGEEEGGEEEEERTALIKSNNHYLAGGEKDKRKCPCA